MPKEHKQDDRFKRLNLADFGAVDVFNLAPVDIPTLVPEHIMSKWMDGDKDPYFKIQKMEYPIKAKGIVYTESFFESFLGKLKDRPIPGSKAGHSIWWGERPNTDFILAGGKLEKTGNESGSVYFKNYIPKIGESGDNSIFIKENQSGMVHFSLVTYPKEITEVDEDGNSIHTAIESLFGERNDAVEYGTGAMKQITNKTDGVAGDEKQNNYRENNIMDKTELLKRLNALKADGDVTLVEIAEAFGQSGKIITDAHKNALKVVEDLKGIGVIEPVKEFTDIQNKMSEDFEAVKNAKISENFGTSKLNEKGEETNLLFNYAQNQLKDVSAEDLEEKINSLKEDPVAKHLSSEAADLKNNILSVESKNEDLEKSGVKILEL